MENPYKNYLIDEDGPQWANCPRCYVDFFVVEICDYPVGKGDDSNRKLYCESCDESFWSEPCVDIGETIF